MSGRPSGRAGIGVHAKGVQVYEGMASPTQGEASHRPRAARGRAIQQPAGRSVRRRHHLLLGAGHHSHHVVRLRRARLCLDRAPAGSDRRCHGPGVRGARRTRCGHRAEDQRPDQQHPERLERRRDRRPAHGDLLRRRVDGQSEERRTRPVAARLRPPGGPGQHRQEDPGQPADPGRPAGPDRHHRWVGEPVHEPVRRSGHLAGTQRGGLAAAGAAVRAAGHLDRCRLVVVHVSLHRAPRGPAALAGRPAGGA